MNTYTQNKSIKPLVLNKEVLLAIEREIIKPWDELKESISESIKEKINLHNKEVKATGYSFKISTNDEISRKIIPKVKIEEMSRDDEFVEKELRYPIRKPKISYKDAVKEIECPNVVELYEHNLQYRFKTLIFTIYGDKSKVIELSFSSYIGLLNSVSEPNYLEVSSSDEAWTMLVSERIAGILKKYEPARNILDNILTRLFFFLVMPILTVYVFSKILGFILPHILASEEFRIWISILLYFLVFLFSIKLYDDIFDLIFPGSVLDDQLPNKNKSLLFIGSTLILGVLSIIIWEVIKYYTGRK